MEIKTKFDPDGTHSEKFCLKGLVKLFFGFITDKILQAKALLNKKNHPFGWLFLWLSFQFY